MARKGVTKQQILQVAKEMIFSNQLPTALKIRTKLKTGSLATIQQYLHKWKIGCFKNAFLSKELELDHCNNNELSEKYYILEQAFNKQIIQNEHYASELINSEKASITLREKNNELHAANQKLQLELSEAKAANHSLEHVTQEINNRLDVNDNKIIQNMQQTINDLRIELKTLNETSLIAIRETSNKGHEALMQEKVTIINLQAKIDSLNKELAEGKKQLNEALTVNQVQTRSLLRQVEWQQKIIQEYIAGEKLHHQKEELGLQTTHTTMVGTYGK